MNSATNNSTAIVNVELNEDGDAYTVSCTGGLYDEDETELDAGEAADVAAERLAAYADEGIEAKLDAPSEVAKWVK